MSPEQLKTLRELRELFVDGSAKPENIRQLSDLLASINHVSDMEDQHSQEHRYEPINDI
ncbi:hypothetical protein [Thalassotalea fusca]